ncbi:MAG: PQQ-binding-like beta-propeller repeat protein [Acidobacteriota bacterium]
MRKHFCLALLSLLALCLAPTLAAEDWPRFRGPEGTGISAEAGLLDSWDEGGPKELWRRPLGRGFSGVSAVGNSLYTLFADRSGEYLVSLATADGSERWRYRLDDLYADSQGDGPRSTPTVSDGVVYAYGAQSMLAAVDAESGKKIWSQDLKKSLGARPPRWGTSAQPVVDGDLLLVDVGGRDGASVAAFRKLTGVLVWSAGSDKAGYSMPLLVEVGGVRQAIFFTATQILAVRPQSGEVLWREPWSTSYNVNAAAPILVPPSRLFISSGYDTGSALFEIETEGDRASVRKVWDQRRMKNQFSSSVLYRGAIFGFDNSILKAIDPATGEELWKARGFQHGSLTAADGKLFVLGEGGRLALVEATAEAYREISSVEPFKAKAWTVPTLADGVLYLRNESEIIALDVKNSASTSTQPSETTAK